MSASTNWEQKGGDVISVGRSVNILFFMELGS